MSNNLDLLAARTAQGIVGTVKVAVEQKYTKWLQAQTQPNKSPTEEEKEKKQKELAKKEPGNLENMATKTLGVLQENGVYAGMLFLYARSKDDYANKLSEHLLASLKEEPINALALALPSDKRPDKWEDVGQHLTEKVCSDLDTLFLVKQLWEQTLIYARYGAKAGEES